MRHLKIWFWGFLTLLTLLWLFAEDWPAEPDLISVRHLAIMLSGVLSMGAMGFSMVLATRPVWLESWLDGLDKTYRLHKWLGITTLVLAVAHWFSVNGMMIIVGEAALTPPDRGGHADPSELGQFYIWTLSQADRAGAIGHITFYITVVFITLALIKKFPYRRFAKTHMFLAVAYLIYVYHSIVLMEFSYWHQPIGIVSAALMLGGSIAALLVLTRRVGHGRKVKGVIEEIDLFPQLGVMETAIRLEDGWKGHQGGQFAFVTFDPKEGAHPFTIGSAWEPENPHINFITKGLGDYTDLMVDKLKVGDAAIVEGPYGRFTFDDEKPHQIWIGAGIGITPFIARMKQLAREPRDQVIDLFAVGPVADQKAIGKLTTDSEAANIRLHIIVDGRDERLTGAGLREKATGWKTASVWFCGPAKFGETLKTDMVTNGLSGTDFHQELFNMR